MNANCLFLTVTIYDSFVWLYILIILLVLELHDLALGQLFLVVWLLLATFANYSHKKTPVKSFGYIMLFWRIGLVMILIPGMTMSEYHIPFILGIVFFVVSQILQMYFSSYVLRKIDDHKQQISNFKEEVPYYANQPNYTPLEQQNVAYSGETPTPTPQNYQPPCSTTSN